jgi:hypothetical protein
VHADRQPYQRTEEVPWNMGRRNNVTTATLMTNFKRIEDVKKHTTVKTNGK